MDLKQWDNELSQRGRRVTEVGVRRAADGQFVATIVVAGQGQRKRYEVTGETHQNALDGALERAVMGEAAKPV